MSVRDKFVELFGEDDCKAIEKAASEHHGWGQERNRGSDPFKWALCVCIGWECIGRFSEYHGIKADPAALKEAIKKHGELASHDGGLDMLSAIAGVYNEYITPQEQPS